ncbi:MAG: hypothetical protein QG577_2173 [Thermodesulfobacteriota bacterium]|nr:hypothetical protein [Thermodesulfobacteriota bacterium]
MSQQEIHFGWLSILAYLKRSETSASLKFFGQPRESDKRYAAASCRDRDLVQTSEIDPIRICSVKVFVAIASTIEVAIAGTII